VLLVTRSEGIEARPFWG